jgi:hypothetical protein
VDGILRRHRRSRKPAQRRQLADVGHRIGYWPAAIAPGKFRCAEFLAPVKRRGLAALGEATDLIAEVIQAVGLPDSSREEGASISEYARHVPSRAVCADGYPPGSRRPAQSLLSALSDRGRKMVQQGSLGEQHDRLRQS